MTKPRPGRSFGRGFRMRVRKREADAGLSSRRRGARDADQCPGKGGSDMSSVPRRAAAAGGARARDRRGRNGRCDRGRRAGRRRRHRARGGQRDDHGAGLLLEPGHGHDPGRATPSPGPTRRASTTSLLGDSRLNQPGFPSDPAWNPPPQRTFNEPGSYTFVCEVHPAMAGTVNVGGRRADPDADPDADAAAGSAAAGRRSARRHDRAVDQRPHRAGGERACRCG